MRVILITAFPDEPESPRGGVEAVSVVLVDALARLGLDIHVLTVRRGIAAARDWTWNGIPVRSLPRRGRWMLTGALGADRRTVVAEVDRLAPDLVHAHDTFGLMADALPYPRVMTIHGFIHGDTRVSGQAWARPRAALWRYVEARAWQEYPDVIAISPYVRERLAGLVQGAVHDIDNPVDRRAFDVERREHPGTILSTAVISRRKNTLGLVEAFAAVHAREPHARLRLAGATVEAHYEEAVRARIAALGLSEHVTMLGPLTSSQVRQELARAAVYALVSREENSPLGIEEAMAAGVPVVTSDRCGMPFMVRHGISGYLVDPESTSGISSAILSLLANPNRRQAMSDAGRQIARDRFHPDAVATRTLQVYERALARRRAVVTAG
jgi:glycosyltransferase involved in cell wall biosynthesis